MLRQFARQLLDDARKAAEHAPNHAALPIGTMTAIAIYPTPLYGEVNGQPVTMLADGDRHGFSPVTKCVDEQNEIGWIPTDLILGTDPRIQPIAQRGRSSRATTTPAAGPVPERRARSRSHRKPAAATT